MKPDHLPTPLGHASLESEERFIATAALIPTGLAAILAMGVTTEHFSTPATRAAWQLAMDVQPLSSEPAFEYGKRVVTDVHLRETIGIELMQRITGQTMTMFSREHLDFYWQILEGCRLHRALTAAAENMVERLRLCSIEETKTLGMEVLAKVGGIVENIRPTAVVGIREAVLRTAADFEDQLQPDEEGRAQLLTWDDTEFDRLENCPRGLVTIAGPTSGGKSVLALELAHGFALRDKRVMVFSLEMDVPQIVRRFAVLEGQSTMHETLNPYGMGEYAWARTSDSLTRLGSLPIMLCDEEGITVERIRTLARLQNQIKKLDIVVVDYIQIATAGKRIDSREAEVSYITAQLKQMAQELKVMVITASQLNDDGKLRESRAISQHSDIVLIITEHGIDVVKNRNGERGMLLDKHLDGSRQRFFPKS